MTLNIQKKGKSRGIEWTDATWNPIAGCPHQCRWTMPDGQEAICYAEDIAGRFAVNAYPEGFAHHYWKPEYLDSPKKAKEPLKIFVGSMSDIFANSVPREQIGAILQVMRDCPQHSFQLLTKNPVRAKEFDLPDNVWLGASMPPDFMWGKPLSREQQKRMLKRTMESLAEAKAVVKWMSFEPLSWDVAPYIEGHGFILQWAVIGAASNGRKYYPPSREVFEKLCKTLNFLEVPIFYKGNLSSLVDRGVERWREEWPTQWLIEMIREEFRK